MLNNKMQLSSCADRRISIETWEVTYTVKVYDWHLSGNETRATNIEKETKKRWRQTLVGKEDRHTGNISVTYVAVIAQKPQCEMKMETQILAHLERLQVKSTQAGTLKREAETEQVTCFMFSLCWLRFLLVAQWRMRLVKWHQICPFMWKQTKCPQNYAWTFFTTEMVNWQFSLVPKGKFFMLFWVLCYDLLFGKWCTCHVK